MNNNILGSANRSLSVTNIVYNKYNTTLLSSTTTVQPDDHAEIDNKNHSNLFIIVPLITVGIIAVLTAMVLLFLRKKRLDRLRHRLMPFYSFEPGEEEDWETELLDEDSDPSSRKGYKSMDYSSSNGHRNHQTRLDRQ